METEYRMRLAADGLPEPSPSIAMFTGQPLHYALLTVLLAGLAAAAGADVLIGSESQQ